MNVASRGIRNAFRNKIRTFSIVLILGLSIGLSLTMLIARQAVQTKIDSVKSTIGNTISVSPAGVQGFQGGGEPLSADQINSITEIDHVVSVRSTLSDRVTADNSTLESAIEPGSLGNRAGNTSGVGFEAPPPMENDENQSQNQQSRSESQQVTRTFTPPIIISGVSDVSVASAYGGDSVTFISGEAFDATSSEDIAVIGTALAEKNNLSVGSTFTVYDTEVKVVGIYDTGNTFSNGGVVMPLTTLQKLSGQEGSITSATVTIDSVDNIDGTVSAIQSTLGEGTADVVSNQESAKNAIEPLENVKTLSAYSLIGAVAAGAVIILLTMMMIVRERRREIGVLKAIGASNTKTTLQFIAEAVTLTSFALVVGLIIGVAASSPATEILVNNSTSSSETAQGSGGRPGGPRGFAGTGVENIRNVQANVGLDIIAYGTGAALVIAMVGSALPAYVISKVRPAEVMRAE